MRRFSEREIAAALDGTFTRFDLSDGSTVTVVVPHDYIPPHTITGRQVGETYTHDRYTEDEDTIIRELRRRRMPAWEIAERIGRTEESVKHRIRVLDGTK